MLTAKELEPLHTFRNLAEMVQARWGLGFMFVGDDAAPRALCPTDDASIDRPPPAPGRASSCGELVRTLSRRFAERWQDGSRDHRSVSAVTCPGGLWVLGAAIGLGHDYLGCLVTGGFSADAAELPVDPEPLALAPTEGCPGAHARAPILSVPDARLLGLLVELGAHEIVGFAQARPAPAGRRPEEVPTRYRYDAIIGRSRPMQELFHLLDKVIDSDSTVLIQGDNGTGKELIAKAIHENSARKDRRFLIQNCSAFNDNLLDSELFGHKKGAFTGAIADKQGLFEVADGGTFFLDEIGDMSAALQVKLLRVLQEGTFMPVGDTTLHKVDVRIIAATNRDLKGMVERGTFREDLFYRINVINLVIPPLRERKEDLPVLMEHFLKKHGRGRRGQKRLGKGCMERMLAYHWPGNVRELENEIERLIVLAGEERTIGEELLSARIRQHDGDAADRDQHGMPGALATLERSMITEALRRHRNNKTRAAAELKISRRNLIRLVQKYEL